jgi:hypothetical protein
VKHETWLWVGLAAVGLYLVSQNSGNSAVTQAQLQAQQDLANAQTATSVASLVGTLI